MWGKHFESMYEGSMYGAGCHVFAVWGYVISHARWGSVELNPRKLADTLGATHEEIQKALDYLTNPDPNSRCKEHAGRRLVKEGEFQYKVPSWETYQLIRNEEARKESNRLAQARYRQKLLLKSKRGPSAIERAAEQARRNGDEQTADAIEEKAGVL